MAKLSRKLVFISEAKGKPSDCPLDRTPAGSKPAMLGDPKEARREWLARWCFAMTGQRPKLDRITDRDVALLYQSHHRWLCGIQNIRTTELPLKNVEFSVQKSKRSQLVNRLGLGRVSEHSQPGLGSQVAYAASADEIVSEKQLALSRLEGSR
jgi:hypothetical protein